MNEPVTIQKILKSQIVILNNGRGQQMDSKLTPRTHDEMLAAVRAFQAERRKWFEESDRRLRERVPDKMQSRK